MGLCLTPYAFQGAINEDGLGLVSWWQQDEGEDMEEDV